MNCRSRLPGVASYAVVCGIPSGLFLASALFAAEPGNPPEPAGARSLTKEIGQVYSGAFDKGLPPGLNPDSIRDPEAIDSAAPVPGKGAANQAAKRAEVVVAPIPSLNPTTGWGLGVPLMVIYKPASQNPESPQWTTGVAGSYSENGTWAAAAFHKMNLRDDTWRLLMAAGYANVNYDLYGVGNEGTNTNLSVPLNQEVTGGLVEVLRETFNDWYVGMRLVYGQSVARLDVDMPQLPPGSPSLKDIALRSTLAAVGLRVQYDSRDDQFFPKDGSLFDIKANRFSNSLGSDYTFWSTTLSYNRYLGVGDGNVLALRAVTTFTSGDVPFYALARISSGADLRGYVSGRYLDSMMFAVQGEYRYGLTERWGLAAFAGVGEVAPSARALNGKNLLPSVGAGLRYRIANQNPINFRLDVARGEDETTFISGSAKPSDVRDMQRINYRSSFRRNFFAEALPMPADSRRGRPKRRFTCFA